MASKTFVYHKGRQAFTSWTAAAIAAGIDLATDTIKAVLVSSAYTPNQSTHQFLSDLGANTLGTAVTLSSKTISATGIFSSANPTFGGMPTSGAGSYIAIYKDTGVAGTSPLIALYDGTATVTCAALAIATATAVAVDPLPGPLASGTAVVFSGGTTATLTAPAAAGARSLTVTALAGGIAQGETASPPTTSSGLPFTWTGSSVSVPVTVDPTNGWFKL